MPIDMQASYKGDNSGHTFIGVTFGVGDISIASSKRISQPDEAVVLVLKQTEPRVLGSQDSSTDGMDTIEHQPDVELRFDNVVSIDLVIKHLKSAKEVLINHQELVKQD